MDLRRSKIGYAIRILSNLVSQPLELSAPDVGEILPVGARGGALVEEDGDLQIAADAFTERAREHDAVLHRGALERHEGDDVRGAHAGMLPAMVIEVDQL